MRKIRYHLLMGLLIFGILVGVSPVQATTVVKKTYLCQYCGHEYQDNAAASTNTFGGQDSEFRFYAAGAQPFAYFIHTCPNCGFPHEYSLFRPAGAQTQEELDNKEKSTVKDCLTTFCENNQVTPDTFTPCQKYEVLAEIHKLRGKPPLAIAEAYIHAAWMADDHQHQEKIVLYRLKAIDYLKEALATKEIKADKVPMFTYLIGELYRRAGKFAEAQEFFSRVKTDDPQLESLLKQQIELARKKDTAKSFIKFSPNQEK